MSAGKRVRPVRIELATSELEGGCYRAWADPSQVLTVLAVSRPEDVFERMVEPKLAGLTLDEASAPAPGVPPVLQALVERLREIHSRLYRENRSLMRDPRHLDLTCAVAEEDRVYFLKGTPAWICLLRGDRAYPAGRVAADGPPGASSLGCSESLSLEMTSLSVQPDDTVIVLASDPDLAPDLHAVQNFFGRTTDLKRACDGLVNLLGLQAQGACAVALRFHPVGGGAEGAHTLENPLADLAEELAGELAGEWAGELGATLAGAALGEGPAPETPASSGRPVEAREAQPPPAVRPDETEYVVGEGDPSLDEEDSAIDWALDRALGGSAPAAGPYRGFPPLAEDGGSGPRPSGERPRDVAALGAAGPGATNLDATNLGATGLGATGFGATGFGAAGPGAAGHDGSVPPARDAERLSWSEPPTGPAWSDRPDGPWRPAASGPPIPPPGRSQPPEEGGVTSPAEHAATSRPQEGEPAPEPSAVGKGRRRRRRASEPEVEPSFALAPAAGERIVSGSAPTDATGASPAEAPAKRRLRWWPFALAGVVLGGAGLLALPSGRGGDGGTLFGGLLSGRDRPVPSGWIEVDPDPPAAAVLLDGERVADGTPARLDSVPAGSRRLGLDLGPCGVWETEVVVRAGEPARVAPVLTGGIEVAPEDASTRGFVWTQGREKTPVPARLDSLPVGWVRIFYEDERLPMWDRLVLVKAGQTSAVTVPNRFRTAQGMVRIEALLYQDGEGLVASPGDSVWIDGQPAGRTPFDATLRPGLHSIRVGSAATGYFSEVLDVKPGSLRHVQAQLGRGELPLLRHLAPGRVLVRGPVLLTMTVSGGGEAAWMRPTLHLPELTPGAREVPMSPVEGSEETYVAVLQPEVLPLGRDLAYYFSVLGPDGQPVWSDLFHMRPEATWARGSRRARTGSGASAPESAAPGWSGPASLPGDPTGGGETERPAWGGRSGRAPGSLAEPGGSLDPADPGEPANRSDPANRYDPAPRGALADPARSLDPSSPPDPARTPDPAGPPDSGGVSDPVEPPDPADPDQIPTDFEPRARTR